MAIAEGVTEIQDSDEESLTSSPVELPEIPSDKLSAAEKSVAHQEPHDATQDIQSTRQAHAKHVSAISDHLDGSAVDQSHNIGVVVESKTETQLDVTAQQEGATIDQNMARPATIEAFNKQHAQLNERLCFNHNSENAKLTMVTEESKQPSTHQMFQDGSPTVIRHKSPSQDLYSSLVTSFDTLKQAMEPSTTSNLECLNENLPQGQTKVSQADIDTMSDIAVNAPHPFSTAITEHAEDLNLTSNPIDHAQAEDLGASIDTVAPPIDMDVPASHYTQNHSALSSKHDFFPSTAVPTDVAMEDNNNEQSKDHESDVTKLVEPCSIMKLATISPSAIIDKKIRADECSTPTVGNEPYLNAQASQEVQRTPNHLTSSNHHDKVSSAAPADIEMNNDPAFAATDSTMTAYHISPESASSSSIQAGAPKTPQEITLAELKVQKAALLASLVALPAVQVVMEEQAALNAGASDDGGEPTEADVMAAANKIVKEHIKFLHEYNELKDMGQGLMGLIADQRGVRIVEVQSEFGIETQD